jgi:two-component system OmpR family response regulator
VKILLVEDDKQTSDYIAKGLREHGHVVDQPTTAATGSISPPARSTTS